MQGTIGREPEIRLYHPVWWHHHGSKMRVKNFSIEHYVLFLKGSAASVRFVRQGSGRWSVDWEVIRSQSEKSGGRILMTKEQMQAAFGLSDESGNAGNWLIQQYGADSADQGSYIRWGKFLNIPCPGTGHDGDPNVSIELDEEMKNAVRQLLA